MTKIDLFPTSIFIFKSDLDTEELGAIITQIQAESNNSVNKSNVGGWQSPTGTLESLSSIYKEQARCLEKILETYPRVVYKLADSWININTVGDYNTSHVHPGSQWSCSTYIKVPGGPIVFEDPRPSAVMDVGNRMNNNTSTERGILPEEGDIIFFPSWLTHRVESSNMEELRITIASNYYLHKEQYNE